VSGREDHDGTKRGEAGIRSRTASSFGLPLILAVISGACQSVPPFDSAAGNLELRARDLAPDLAAEILEAAVEERSSLAVEFGHDPAARLSLIIEEGDLRNGSHGYYTSGYGWIGDCLVFPRESAAEIAGSRRPLLRHEMAHFFTYNLVEDVHRWYSEGVAEYLCFDKGWSDDEVENLFWIAETIDEEFLERLLQSTPAEFSIIDVRSGHLETSRTLSIEDMSLNTGPTPTLSFVGPGGVLYSYEGEELPESLLALLDPFLDGPALMLEMRQFAFKEMGKRFPYQSVTGFEYIPGSHYDASRLVVASLHAQGWPILREDPTEALLADTGAALDAVSAYTTAQLRMQLRRFASDAEMTPAMRRTLAGILCKEMRGLGGTQAALSRLVQDPDAAVRDRAALALFLRGERAYSEWVLSVYEEQAAPVLLDAEPDDETDQTFFVLLAHAVSQDSVGEFDPHILRERLAAGAADLPEQIARER
jgi:hypothetical protein